jgi:Reverse transcriptase (RNA-dependent DNA polymerase)
MNVFELVPLPPGRTSIPTLWVFATKRDSDGNVVRHKARLVADGSKQASGVDYDSVFAPTSHLASLRLLLSIAAVKDLEIIHFDVKTAFLHGDLAEDIYMRQPPGYTDGSGKVWKLRKSLYGLKQAARAWHV